MPFDFNPQPFTFTSMKKKDKLLLNIAASERHKHKVAMVTDEGVFNTHEPNSNMARMFVVMLLIHVVVIGGIIVYDFLNGEEAPVSELATPAPAPAPASALPVPAVSPAMLEKERPIEEYATYEWRSGDSIPSVARKLAVSEEELIRLNMLDQGVQLDQNSILRYPKRPVVQAIRVGVADAAGPGVAPAAAVVSSPPAPAVSIAAAEVPISLAVPGERSFSFQPTIENELTPAPAIMPGQAVASSPPPAVSREPAGEPAMPAVQRVELPVVQEQPPPAPAMVQEAEKAVPKAIPVPRPPAPVVRAEPVQETPPPARKETAARSHTVRPGETLYRIATKYGVSVGALQTANKITRPELLRDGMKLTIPAK